MGNRVYLYCTAYDRMPNKAEWSDFFTRSGTEYETQGLLPYFWLCLFDTTCIKIDPADRNGFEDDDRAYAYLLGKRMACVERLRKIAALIGGEPSSSLHLRLTEWIARLASSPYENIIVRTEELDWMGEEGALEKEITKALRHHEKCLAQGQLGLSQAIRYICGLGHNDELLECEPAWLFGNANDGTSWPSVPMATTQAAKPIAEGVTRSWWKLW